MSEILTSREKREQRIEQLKARLQREQNLHAKELKRERNGQLIAWGILVELMYKLSPDTRPYFKNAAEKLMKDRNLNRALNGFARLDDEIQQKNEKNQ